MTHYIKMSQQGGNRKKMKRYNTGNEILTALKKSQKKKRTLGDWSRRDLIKMSLLICRIGMVVGKG